MTLWQMALHLLNFAAPALGVALWMGLLGIFFKKKSAPALYIYADTAMYFAVGLGVLLVGLALGERDARVGTYVAVVLAVGSLAAWRHR